MKQPTKQQQKDEAWTAYCAIIESADKAYAAKLKEIDAQPDEVEQIDAQPDEPTQTLQDLMKKHCIEHGYENDQSNLDDFIAEVTKLIKENN